MRRHGVLVAAMVVAPSMAAQAPGPRAATAPVSVTASLRIREEAWDWFDAGPAGRYAFTGVTARAGLAGTSRRVAWRAEVMVPVLLGLPNDAVQPAPSGQLGLGAAYAAASGAGTAARVLPRQAWVRLGPAGAPQLTLGRLEVSDGAEFTPRHPVLAAVRAQRVNQRLIGPFGFTHVGRGFDGARLGYDRPGRGLTLLAVRPTEGVFSTRGFGALPVDLVYAAASREVTLGRGALDLRALGTWYADRRGLAPVDARPATVRAADRERIGLWTTGGHVTAVHPCGPLTCEMLAWGVVQGGDWGRQRQRAGAAVLEVGVQATTWRSRPWLRAGISRSTGDRTPGDATHATFVQLLPTPRPFARFPFYNMMNTDEAMLSAQWRLAPTLSARLGASHLTLAAAEDLWYGGGGPFDRQAFGYAGRPTHGARALATVGDASLEWRPSRHAAFELYGAQARGGAVIRRTWPGDGRGGLLYLEATLTR